MHIVAQLRPIDLHNFQAKYQRVVSFWVPVNYPSLNELVSMPQLWCIHDAYLLSFAYPPIYACVSYLSAMILLFLDLQGALFHSPLELEITVNSIQSHVSLLPGLRPGSVQVENFFRTSGELNPRPWPWIKSIRNQHVKCNERQTSPCHRAYSIGGATPFHSCMIVRSPKLVSSEDQTGARTPSASYCSIEVVAPLHTAPPVPVTAPPVPVKYFILFFILRFTFVSKNRRQYRSHPVAWKSGLKVPLLPVGLPCPLQTILLSGLVGCESTMQIVMAIWRTIIVSRGLLCLTQKVKIKTKRAPNCHYYLQRAVTPDWKGSIAL